MPSVFSKVENPLRKRVDPWAGTPGFIMTFPFPPAPKPKRSRLAFLPAWLNPRKLLHRPKLQPMPTAVDSRTYFAGLAAAGWVPEVKKDVRRGWGWLGGGGMSCAASRRAAGTPAAADAGPAGFFRPVKTPAPRPQTPVARVPFWSGPLEDITAAAANEGPDSPAAAQLAAWRDMLPAIGDGSGEVDGGAAPEHPTTPTTIGAGSADGDEVDASAPLLVCLLCLKDASSPAADDGAPGPSSAPGLGSKDYGRCHIGRIHMVG
ncbi:hypothetical protein EDC01DRAFT_785122 [Geopyxis carbonaria]|nr:hypothetical protein EDC01DRAFT_785122 [Geopyxis carbonaria]